MNTKSSSKDLRDASDLSVDPSTYTYVSMYTYAYIHTFRDVPHTHICVCARVCMTHDRISTVQNTGLTCFQRIYVVLTPSLTALPGCCLTPSASTAALFLSHSHHLSHSPLPHVARAPQRRLVLLAMDAFHFHGDTPRPGCSAPRPVGVPIRQHGADPILVIRQHHGDAPSPVFSAHVPDGNQRCDIH